MWRALLSILALSVACSGSDKQPPPRGAPSTGGEVGTGGSGGIGIPGNTPTGGSSSTGGAPAPTPDAAAQPPDATGASPDGAVAPVDGASIPTGPTDYGGVGQLVLIPLQYTAEPVPPMVAAECPDDPTAGFTEYQDSFVVQRPYDLAAADRFKYENGVYSFFVNSSDKAHAPGNGTAPRTEARYSDMSTGEHIWSADVMYESPSRTCIQQIHNVVGAIANYLRVVGNRMFNLGTGTTILMDAEKKWFNLKVYFNAQNRQVKTYVNNCLKETSTAPSGMPYWYFKHGVYTCDSGTCRSSYKNIHLWQKGSTDKYNVKSTFP